MFCFCVNSYAVENEILMQKNTHKDMGRKVIKVPPTHQMVTKICAFIIVSAQVFVGVSCINISKAYLFAQNNAFNQLAIIELYVT